MTRILWKPRIKLLLAGYVFLLVLGILYTHDAACARTHKLTVPWTHLKQLWVHSNKLRSRNRSVFFGSWKSCFSSGCSSDTLHCSACLFKQRLHSTNLFCCGITWNYRGIWLLSAHFFISSFFLFLSSLHLSHSSEICVCISLGEVPFFFFTAGNCS